MRYLLDTNVVSEVRKGATRGHSGVRKWVSSRSPTDLYLSAITILEVELGIGRLRRRDHVQSRRLQAWLEEDLLQVFDGRILPIDVPVTRRAARLHIPDPCPERDALIAASAIVHDLTVVTRNVTDSDLMGVAVSNPWERSG